jgi:uracil-DNA glycosylase family 4
VSLHGTIVPPFGPKSSGVLLIGERPGRFEAATRRPFQGPSGKEQAQYLARYGVDVTKFRMANLCPEYDEHNADPSVEMIRKWTPTLEAEIKSTAPRLIGAVGRYSMRWLLGEQAELDSCWGLAHQGGALDPTIAHRANGAIVVPLVHPAAGLHDGDARGFINAGYGRFADVLKRLQAGKSVEIRRDEYAGKESYRDITGAQLAKAVSKIGKCSVVGLDTEGTLDNPWSVQVSLARGTGLCLRCSQPDFAKGIAALQQATSRGALIVIHNGMYDLGMCQAMGLDLSRARLFDTMIAAYLLRLEPQGLKALSWRWCGVKMSSYQDTVGDVGRDKQLLYLCEIISREWPKPDAEVVFNNDGTVKLYQPQAIGRRAESILSDAYSEGADPYERWKQVDKKLRATVERELGPMPIGTLADLPLDRAIGYSTKDCDVTLRLYYKLKAELERLNLTSLMDACMATLPVFSEMQSNGMPASRPHFEKLAEDMWDEMCVIQQRLSKQYYGGQPFNPGSHIHVGSLLRRRGLEPAKRTSTGAMSTGKASIEYLRYTDPAISDVFEWRERRHIKDSFAEPVLERIPEGTVEVCDIKPQIKTTRIPTRRLASTDPNLLAIPVRNDIGRRVRAGYQCADGEVFGAWDLSSIEMRVAAHFSADPLMCELFHAGFKARQEGNIELAEELDVHRQTAARIFKIPVREVDKFKHRLPAKNAGFGTLYGIGGEGLLIQLKKLGIEGWTRDSCDRLIRDWLKTYKGIDDYIKRTIARVSKTGIVTDYSGMMRHVPAIFSDDPKLRSEAGRQAVNHEIQGTAQTMIQNSIAWLKPIVWKWQDEGYNVKWRLLIHDEIILTFARELWDMVNPVVLEGLTQHSGIELSVPIEAEGHMASNWGELK